MKIIRLVLAVFGLAFLAIGAYALATTLSPGQIPSLAGWLIGVLVVHDAIIVPLTIVVGFALSKTVSARVRPVVQGGLIVAAILSLISIPVVLAYGRYPENPSLLPLDYGRNIVIILITVGLITGLLVGIRLLRTSNRNDSEEAAAEPVPSD